MPQKAGFWRGPGKMGPHKAHFPQFWGNPDYFFLFLLFPLCPDNHPVMWSFSTAHGRRGISDSERTGTSSLRTGEGGRDSGEEASMVSWACREHTPDTSVGSVPPGPRSPPQMLRQNCSLNLLVCSHRLKQWSVNLSLSVLGRLTMKPRPSGQHIHR